MRKAAFVLAALLFYVLPLRAGEELPRGPVTVAREVVSASTSSLSAVTLATPVNNTFYEFDGFLALGSSPGTASGVIYAEAGHDVSISTIYSSASGSAVEVDITYTNGLGNSVTLTIFNQGTGISSLSYSLDVVLVKK